MRCERLRAQRGTRPCKHRLSLVRSTCRAPARFGAVGRLSSHDSSVAPVGHFFARHLRSEAVPYPDPDPAAGESRISLQNDWNGSFPPTCALPPPHTLRDLSTYPPLAHVLTAHTRRLSSVGAGARHRIRAHAILARTPEPYLVGSVCYCLGRCPMNAGDPSLEEEVVLACTSIVAS